jgi:hypothetical protein
MTVISPIIEKTDTIPCHSFGKEVPQLSIEVGFFAPIRRAIFHCIIIFYRNTLLLFPAKPDSEINALKATTCAGTNSNNTPR